MAVSVLQHLAAFMPLAFSRQKTASPSWPLTGGTGHTNAGGHKDAGNEGTPEFLEVLPPKAARRCSILKDHDPEQQGSNSDWYHCTWEIATPDLKCTLPIVYSGGVTCGDVLDAMLGIVH